MKYEEKSEIGSGPLQLPGDILHLSSTAAVCGSQFKLQMFPVKLVTFSSFSLISIMKLD